MLKTIELPVPEGEKIDAPLASNPEEKVPVEEKLEVPVTDKVPPKLVAPLATVRLLPEAIVVLPLSEILPVPVEKEPVPD